MRTMFAVLIAGVLALSACSVETSTEGASAPAEASGYTFEIVANDQEQIFVVSHEDGRAAAAQAVEGQSRSITPDEAAALIGRRQAAFQQPGEEVVTLRVPGAELSIQGDDAQNNEAVRINIQTKEGGVTVNAQDQGEGNGRAHVRVTGADEEAARDFINEQEDLSPEVKAEMLAALGL